MPHATDDPSGSPIGQGRPGMRPPQGFASEIRPLRHRFGYKCGLSAKTATMNSVILTVAKHYKGAGAPDTVVVNPHNTAFDGEETGAICTGMSIIDKVQLSINIGLTKHGIGTNGIKALKGLWRPIFFSFPEKLDAIDLVSSNTVKGILEMTPDATQEDVTPLWSTTKLPIDGDSDLAHPVSTVNLTEVFGLMNLTTDTTMESVAYSDDLFHKALQFYTNKGALKACVGRTRNFFLTEKNPNASFFIKKFVPRSVRRIVAYSYFGILVHIPITTDKESIYHSASLTPSKPDVGVGMMVRYHEWHPDHNQDMA